MTCTYKKISLLFKKPGGTSRGVLNQKDTYIIILTDGGKTAYGECNRFVNLSYDDRPEYEEKLTAVCRSLSQGESHLLDDLHEWPSIRFGVEMVLKDWENGSRQILFPEVMDEAGFTVPVNGLIWMGTKGNMMDQISVKLKEGFTSIKLKIGAIDFDAELELMKFIRSQFTKDEVEIRTDANGGFQIHEAAEKIKRLSDYDIHYIEQPIKAGNWEEMAALTENTPVKIALDEELIGIITNDDKKRLIDTINPQMLILKPALAGGFASCNEWKQLIETAGGEWVITSALESNIGLNAIAQYTASAPYQYAQGLGTGQLFTNNFPSPYTVDANGLHYHTDKNWDFSQLQ